jgi:hypothetical protein
MNIKIYTILLIIITFISCNQQQDEKATSVNLHESAQASFQADTTIYCQDKYYNLAFQEINQMLENKIPINFKRAAFLIEWAYLQGNLDYSVFCKDIAKIAEDLKQFIKDKQLEQYKTAGNYALFEFFTKPHPMNNYKPFSYDFEDFYGGKDYTNVFVTKLLRTHKGQCRSMPILYKILAEEIKAESYLALGPNHLYIKHIDKQNKWVNIELTNEHFSSDSWMISSSGISAEAIQSGIYMKDLTLKESIAFCMTELSLAYTKQYGYTEFSLFCCNASIKHHKNSVNAILHKNITLKSMGLAYKKKHGNKPDEKVKKYYDEWLATHYQLNELGHREVTKEQYAQWTKEMESERIRRQKQSNN